MSRKLDALYAERVLGQNDISTRNGTWFWRYKGDGVDCTSVLPFFTQSLDAAWAGVEKLAATDTGISMDINSCYPDVNEPHHVSWEVSLAYNGTAYCDSDSLPLALVKACLLAVGVSQEEIDEVLE